jgi:hypothetical protein
MLGHICKPFIASLIGVLYCKEVALFENWAAKLGPVKIIFVQMNVATFEMDFLYLANSAPCLALSVF